MSERRYMIGCGYHDAPGDGKREFFRDYWIQNTWEDSGFARIFVIADSNCEPPHDPAWPCEHLKLTGDLGFHLELLDGRKTHRFPTGPMVLCTLAMIAYLNEYDLIYKEQDCLWFGDCVGKMYEEIGDGGIIFGSCECMPATNSLFLLKHHFIPDYVSLYMGSEPENVPENICEHKIARMAERDPKNWKRFSFPFDRDRPLNFDLPVWYAQKFTADELAELKTRGMI